MDKRYKEQIAMTRDHFDQLDKRFDEQIAVTRERFAIVDTRFIEQAGADKERFKHLKERMNRQFSVILIITSILISGVASIIYKGF